MAPISPLTNASINKNKIYRQDWTVHENSSNIQYNQEINTSSNTTCGKILPDADEILPHGGIGDWHLAVMGPWTKGIRNIPHGCNTCFSFRNICENNLLSCSSQI